MEQNNGYKIPFVGLGTWLASSDEIRGSVTSALDAGYRLIDTAYAYGNEKAVGSALESWLTSNKLERNVVYITSKLPPIGMTADKVEHFCKLSLANLKVDYLDLYLVHVPAGLKYKGDEELLPRNEDGSVAVDFSTSLETIWKEMEKLVQKGFVKSIGISNFNQTQIERILKMAEILPVVLQIELHAYMQQKELRNFCEQKGIVVQAYSPLAGPGRPEGLIGNTENVSLLTNEVVKEIAEKCRKSPAQVLLKYLVQQGIPVTPKSVHHQRVKENIDIFDFTLSGDQMETLRNLDRGSGGRTLDFNFFGPQIYLPEMGTHLVPPISGQYDLVVIGTTFCSMNHFYFSFCAIVAK